MVALGCHERNHVQRPALLLGAREIGQSCVEQAR